MLFGICIIFVLEPVFENVHAETICVVSFKEDFLLLLCFFKCWFIFLSLCFGDLNADVLNFRATVSMLFTFTVFIYLFIGVLNLL